MLSVVLLCRLGLQRLRGSSVVYVLRSVNWVGPSLPHMRTHLMGLLLILLVLLVVVLESDGMLWGLLILTCVLM